MKQVQHNQDIFLLAGSTEPNIRRPDNQYYEAGYQLAQSTLGFHIQLLACSCERDWVVNNKIRTMSEVLHDMRWNGDTKYLKETSF